MGTFESATCTKAQRSGPGSRVSDRDFQDSKASRFPGPAQVAAGAESVDLVRRVVQIRRGEWAGKLPLLIARLCRGGNKGLACGRTIWDEYRQTKAGKEGRKVGRRVCSHVGYSQVESSSQAFSRKTVWLSPTSYAPRKKGCSRHSCAVQRFVQSSLLGNDASVEPSRMWCERGQERPAHSRHRFNRSTHCASSLSGYQSAISSDGAGIGP